MRRFYILVNTLYESTLFLYKAIAMSGNVGKLQKSNVPQIIEDIFPV